MEYLGDPQRLFNSTTCIYYYIILRLSVNGTIAQKTVNLQWHPFCILHFEIWKEIGQIILWHKTDGGRFSSKVFQNVQDCIMG